MVSPHAALPRWPRLLGALACAACGTDAPPATGDASKADTTVAEAVFGEVEGAEQDLFGDVQAVAVGPRDLIYVADRQPPSVRAFTPSGRFVGWVGREGDGPGEFRWPTDLVFDREGRLYARDLQRVTVYAPAAEGALPDSVLRTMTLPGYGNSAMVRAATDGTLYYYPDSRLRPDDPDEYFYLPFDSSGATGDTLRVPELPNREYLQSAFVVVAENTGRMIRGVNRAPFEPTATWAITAEGTILASPGDAYRIVEVDGGGDTLRAIAPAAGGAVPVPEAEARDSAAAFRARLDSLPVPVADVRRMSPVARSGTLPSALPEVLALHTDAEGRIWVRRWPRKNPSSVTAFDMLGPDGEIERTVLLPARLRPEPPPHIAGDLIVGVVVDPATEVQRVGVFRVPGGDP